jgi:hypothetical protein
LVLFFVLLIVSGLVTKLLSGLSKMRKFGTAVPAGSATNEIVRLFGKPSHVVNGGDPVPGPRNHFKMTVVPENSILYFYGRDGIPYFQVFYLIDARSGKVTESVVDNLWW